MSIIFIVIMLYQYIALKVLIGICKCIHKYAEHVIYCDRIRQILKFRSAALCMANFLKIDIRLETLKSDAEFCFFNRWFDSPSVWWIDANVCRVFSAGNITINPWEGNYHWLSQLSVCVYVCLALYCLFCTGCIYAWLMLIQFMSNTKNYSL